MSPPQPVITCKQEAGGMPEEVAASAVFQRWLSKSRDLGITSVEVHAVIGWGTPHAIKMVCATVRDAAGNSSLALMRGATADALTIISRTDKPEQQLAAFVGQKRLPGAQQWLWSNPAGMIDPGVPATLTALEEINQELGTLKYAPAIWGAPVNMLDLLTGMEPNMAALVSPGGSDEENSFFRVHAELEPTAFEALVQRLDGSNAGLAAERESTLVRVTTLDEPEVVIRRLVEWSHGGSVDLKTVTSLLLNDRLNRLRRIEL